MAKKKKVTERLRVRLDLRSSNAAQKHRNRKREETNPGHGTRAAQQRAALRERFGAFFRYLHP
jgi:hypothetical protein